MQFQDGHCVAIFGGAVAGAEAAAKFAARGIYTVVFEQNALPYGKIEDGLPKWHIKLRDKEEQKIDERLNQQNVWFVPLTKLGRDITFESIVNEWGFSAVLLAVGAWRDRPLPVEGIDAYVDRGLYYQNPFIYWFNHYHEPTYSGPQCEIHDGSIVIGGGLASIDVIKVLMFETVGRTLAKRGHTVDLFTLEKEGPAKVLARLGLTMDDLGLQGCTLYYRRQAINMPISPIPEDADATRIQKAHALRQRMIRNWQEKYLFKFVECHMPVDKIVENDRLAGLVFQKTEVVGGRVKPIPDAFVEVRSPVVVSSIGSIPEPIEGVPWQGNVFDVMDEATGRITGFENVFALGNAVTGRGNIKESRSHSITVADYVLEHFLPSSEGAGAQARRSAAQIAEIIERVRERQKAVGYDGNYEAWRKRHLPVRLEHLLE